MKDIYKINWGNYLSDTRYRQSEFSQKPKESLDKRNAFESDFGRVIFSSALRRMHDKTQVVPMTSGDNIHTRLPHSLEVMSLAYSLGINYCRHSEISKMYSIEERLQMEQTIPVILKTAACVHDIGNPPFGHFGETIIKNWFVERFKNDHMLPYDQELDFTEYDGNAQGFRILTKQQFQGDLSGLNLTYATLAAYLKYPNKGPKHKNGNIGEKKHGIFFNECDVFDEIVDRCHLVMPNGKIKRHPLAFLTEAADTICYSVMDIEDGYSMGCYSFKDMIDDINQIVAKNLDKADSENLEFYHREFKNKFNIYDLIKFKDDKIDKSGKNHPKSDRVKMTDFRVKLFSYLTEKAIEAFISNLHEIDNGEYQKELVDEDPYMICKALTEYARKKIFKRKDVELVELTGSSVITGLLDIMTKYSLSDDEQYRNRIKNIMSKSLVRLARLEDESNNLTKDDKKSFFKFFSDDDMIDFDLKDLSPYQKIRLIVDNISGMTDKYAVSLFRELSGSKL